MLDRSQEKNIHTGYFWFYQSSKALFVQYHRSRGSEPPDEILKNYQGKIQTDGYGVYEHFEKNEDITLFAPLFTGEIKQKELGPKEAAQLCRYKRAIPMTALKQWITRTKPKLKPKMKLYGAIEYIENDGKNLKLTSGTERWKLKIASSRMLLAIGRKNYLFVGSQKAGKSAAIFYSLIGSYKMAKVNPLEWLTDVIKNINDWLIKQLHLLLPSNWKSERKQMQVPA